MTEPLYNSITNVGEKNTDLTEGFASQTDMEGFMELIDQYDTTADPDNDRYLLQDGEHQYEIRVQQVDTENEQIVASARDSGFAKEGLENVNVLEPEDFERNPRDGATFDDGSDYLNEVSERVE